MQKKFLQFLAAIFDYIAENMNAIFNPAPIQF